MKGLGKRVLQIYFINDGSMKILHKIRMKDIIKKGFFRFMQKVMQERREPAIRTGTGLRDKLKRWNLEGNYVFQFIVE